MNFRTTRREEIDINLTPLIDIVFLLLIFFMVSTTFERKSAINVTLPKASQESTGGRDEAIHVAIDARGRVYVNGRALPDARHATIGQGLREALLRKDPSGRTAAPVLIDADAAASHQAVIRVMDAARRLGLFKITFATRVLEE